LNRSLESARPLARAPQGWLLAALALTLAVGAGLLLTQMLMAPPAGEMRDLAAYLTLSGAATLGLGWLALRATDGAVGLTIRGKAFLSAATGSGMALLNVLIVAQLMFVSTAHDLKLLLALVAFSGVVTLFFSLWVASVVSARVEAVAAGIRALAGGNYAARLNMSGSDEVAGLAAGVDSLAVRLELAEQERAALDRERRELTAAISHDLRTPLASVRAMVEALDDRVVDDPSDVERYYGIIRREIERLSRMIDDLFELARIDAGVLQLDLHAVSLQEVAAEVVDAMQPQGQRRGVTVELVVDGSPPDLELDGARIERAVANLVRNAIEHSPHGGRVEVRVASDRSSVALDVLDAGEGIGDADMAHIWERFYRAEKSRNRPAESADGAGLGLAIVRGIVEAHGGSVHASSSPGSGARFTLQFPHRERMHAGA
jgi:signal transduction histidine kinase